MADLGAIGTTPTSYAQRTLSVWAAGADTPTPATNRLSADVPQRWWASADRANVPCSYSLSGTVLRIGVPLAGATVRLYLRASGMLVATTSTDGSGGYVFTDLPADASAFFGVVADPLGSENALILDRLTAA